MTVKITKPVQGGTVKAIASKSEAHRQLICAALGDKKTTISCPECSEDIEATTHCLIALGAEISYQNGCFTVTPINRGKLDDKKNYLLDCGESGATLRFILPVCGALGITAQISMGGRLPERPLSALYDEMVSHGCKLSEHGISPLICSGQLKSGTYTLPGNITSQYISGLLFALPLLPGDSKIHLTSKLQSRSYVEITLNILSKFGVEIIDTTDGFIIPGSQVFRSPRSLETGGDWSNAAFWLCAGAIGLRGITCTNLDFDSKQGDKQIIDVLKRFGAHVKCGKNSATVTPGILKGIDIKADDIPDLIPVLAAVASVATGKTTIYNAERLRSKESDRLQTVTKVLTDLGADVTETKDGMVIEGKLKLDGGTVEAFNDHRIAMTAAILSTACSGDVEIKGADAVRKSYPGFFRDFKDILGGDFKVSDVKVTTL